MSPPHSVPSWPMPVNLRESHLAGLDDRPCDKASCRDEPYEMLGQHTRRECPLPVKCYFCEKDHWSTDCASLCNECTREFRHSTSMCANFDDDGRYHKEYRRTLIGRVAPIVDGAARLQAFYTLREDRKLAAANAVVNEGASRSIVLEQIPPKKCDRLKRREWLDGDRDR